MDCILDYDYLNACRLQSGLSNKAIATTKNLSESTVSRFFRGEIKSPDIQLVHAICDAIGASIDRALGLVKPVAEAVTEPTPSLPAVVTDVVQTVSDIVDEDKLATSIVEKLKKSPIAAAVDARELARAIVDMMPRKDCDSCKASAAYEKTISGLMRAVAALGGTVVLMTLFQMYLLLAK